MSKGNMSKCTILLLCVSQVVVTVGVVCFFEPLQIEVYSVVPPQPPDPLSTMMDHHLPPPQFRETSLSICTAVLASSIISVIFSISTVRLLEKEVLKETDNNILLETELWDFIFWVYSAIVHAIIFLIVMSPADIYAVTLTFIQYSYFLMCMCKPRQKNELLSTIIQISGNVLGLLAALLIAMHNFAESDDGHVAAMVVMVILDCILAVGHTSWDSKPSMDIITKYRLLWACSSSFFLAVLYTSWNNYYLLMLN